MGNFTSVATPEAAAPPAWLDAQEFPFVSHFIEVEGNTIHYIDEGHGPTLVFLHGIPLWSYQYRNIIKSLRDRFRCIALDYPGFGLSVAAGGFQNTVSTNIRLVESFIRKLNLNAITFVLHDVSTPVGIAVAERNPALMQGLVLTNGFAWPLDDYPSINLFVTFLGTRLFRFLAVRFNFFTWFTVNFLGSKLFRFLVIHSDPLTPSSGTNIGQGLLSPAARRAYFEPFRARSRRHHQVDFFRSVTVDRDVLVDIERRSEDIAHLPALIMFGDTDAAYPAGWHERLGRMFPGHRIDIIKGAHHFPQEYDPQYFAAAIRRWWDELGTSRQARTINTDRIKQAI